jgi:hypothetical protein
MIDYSNEIFNTVATDLRSLYPEVTVIGEYVEKPTRFPTTTLDEISNVPVHLDSATNNKYAKVIYRSQTFCNGEGKRKRAREIFNSLDNKLMELGLQMKTYTTTPTIYNSEVYCITATHEGVIGIDGTIYRA